LQTEVTSATHSSSQPPAQQNGSTAHTAAAHGCEVLATGAPCSQSGWGIGEQVPQSDAHVAQLSPAYASQTRLPHAETQLPQSPGQLKQFSTPPHV